MTREIDLIQGDRGSAVITLAMQMSGDYPTKARELEQVITEQFPHLQFWVGERFTDRALILEWEPRDGATL